MAKKSRSSSQNDGRRPVRTSGKRKPRITKKLTVKKKLPAKVSASTKKKAAKTKEKKQLDPEVIESKLKRRINSIPCSEKNTFQLEWPSKPISKKDEERVSKRLVTKGYYGPLDAQHISDIETRLKSTEMSLPQAVSLRSALLTQKAASRHPILKRNENRLCKQYKGGQSILDLAKKVDQPPMNVLRQILSAMSWSKGAIKQALRDPSRFEPRERTEFLAAESMDLTSCVNHDDIHEHSENFEDILSNWLHQKGIRFVRQKQLEAEQKAEFGNPILTPDFLLLDQVYINGTPCHWVDCKAYYGANCRFSIQTTKKQMKRYKDRWGSGAIVYLQGFSEAIVIQDCLLLNGYGALDKKLLSTLEDKICAAKNSVSLTTFNDEGKEKKVDNKKKIRRNRRR